MCAAKLMGIFKKCLSTQDKKQNVVYFPGAACRGSPEYEREMALNRERERTLHSIPTGGTSDLGDEMSSLPVSVAISQDGEEGYCTGQKGLLPRHLRPICDIGEVERESVHPPPNRTVFDGESPPPYRSHGSLHIASGGSPGSGGGRGCGSGSLVGAMDSKHTGGNRKPNQVSNNGISPRCYSGIARAGGVANNNNTTNYNPNLNSVAPSTGVAGSTRGLSTATSTHHPLHQYHRPHVFSSTQPHNGIVGSHNVRASQHNHRPRSEEDAMTNHTRHSSGSSSSSAGSSMGSPPNYNDVIANSNFNLLSDATQRSDADV